MTVLDTLAALARGEQPATGLLHTCRFEGFGSETYGVEAIVERFRHTPVALSAAEVVQTPGHIAVFAPDHAIFADVFGANIARLWLLGGAAGAGIEHGRAVPFDPDLDQLGGDVLLGAGDHPQLAPAAAARVAALGRAITAGTDAPRARGYALRAFGTEAAGAALFAVFRLRPGALAVAGFTLAAARWAGADTHFQGDPAGEAALAASRWVPCLAP